MLKEIKNELIEDGMQAYIDGEFRIMAYLKDEKGWPRQRKA